MPVRPLRSGDIPPALIMAGPTDRVLAQVSGVLTPAEQARADRFRRDGDRRDFVAAHLLVRRCAAEVLAMTDGGAAPGELTLVQHCDRCGAGHGRPAIAEAPQLAVSLAHTRGYVCAAAGHGRVGVDVEHALPGPADEILAATVLTPAEAHAVGGDNRRLIRWWVRKEALVKRGELTLDRLRDADLSDLGHGPSSLIWRGRHVTEWASGPVLGTAITDGPARLLLL